MAAMYFLISIAAFKQPKTIESEKMETRRNTKGSVVRSGMEVSKEEAKRY